MFRPQQNTSHVLPIEEMMLNVLGKQCRVLTMSVIQLFLTDISQRVTRRKHECGVLCLVKDSHRRSFFFNVYCIFRKKMVWEHEVKSNLHYLSPKPFLYIFEKDDVNVIFKFSNEDEARQLRNVLLEKCKKREEKHESHERSQQQSSSNIPQLFKTKVSSDMSAVSTPLSDGVHSGQQKVHSSVAGNKRKEPKPKLTIQDIGFPQDFRHVSHVGWDPVRGFVADIGEDPELKQFFEKAGVSDSHLQDRETREFIYDFINRHGGIDSVKKMPASDAQEKHVAVPSPEAARPTLLNATRPRSWVNHQTLTAPVSNYSPPVRSDPLPATAQLAQPSVRMPQPPPPPPFHAGASDSHLQDREAYESFNGSMKRTGDILNTDLPTSSIPLSQNISGNLAIADKRNYVVERKDPKPPLCESEINLPQNSRDVTGVSIPEEAYRKATGEVRNLRHSDSFYRNPLPPIPSPRISTQLTTPRTDIFHNSPPIPAPRTPSIDETVIIDRQLKDFLLDLKENKDDDERNDLVSPSAEVPQAHSPPPPILPPPSSFS